MEKLSHPLLVRLCQIAIGLIFAWAALAKIGSPQGFATQIHHFRLLPVALENMVAFTLPWVEIVAALALVLGIRARASAVLSFGLLVVFTVAVAVAVARGLDIDCGCFGTGDGQQVGLVKIVQNLGMIVVAGIASLRPR